MTNSGSPSQPKSRSNSSKNPGGRQRPKDVEVIEGILRDGQGPTGTHGPNSDKGGVLNRPNTARALDDKIYSHGNGSSGGFQQSQSNGSQYKVGAPTEGGGGSVSHSQAQFDATAARYTKEKHSPGSHRRPTSEGEGSTGSQNPSEAQDTFDLDAGYQMGEGSQSAHDISTINTSIQRTQGKFDANSGSYNNYGDKDSRFVNEGTFVNKGRIEVNFGPSGGEGPRNVGRYAILHLTPLLY